MTGPKCIGGITGNCCQIPGQVAAGETVFYKYGNRYATCQTAGSSGPAPISDAGTPVTTPTMAPTAAAVASMCVMYTVKAGDTLNSIAATYTANDCAVTAEAIIDFNEVPAADVEQRLSLLTRWIVDSDQTLEDYGLRLTGEEFPPAHGDAHRRRCLEALALFDENES